MKSTLYTVNRRRRRTMEINESDFSYITVNLSSMENYDLPMGFKSVMLVLYAIIIIVSINGNVVLLYTIYTMPKKRINANNYFVASFAISDILMGTLCIPFTCISNILYSYWPFGSMMCPIVSFAQVGIVLQRSFIMMAVSFERHHAIARRMKKPFAKRKVKLVILTIWLIAIIGATPTAVFSTIVHLPFEPGIRGLCLENWPSNTNRDLYNSIILSVQYGIPLIILTSTYVHIGYIIWNNKIPGEVDTVRDNKIAKSKRKTVKMLVAVVLMFIFTWLPLHSLNIFGDIDPSIYDRMYVHMVWLGFHWLALSNSASGCVIYIAMSSVFRNGFKRCLYNVSCGRLYCIKSSLTYNDSRLKRSYSDFSPHIRRCSSDASSVYRLKPWNKLSLEMDPINNNRGRRHSVDVTC